MKRLNISFLLVIALLSVCIVQARSFVARSRATLKNEIASNRYVIVMFYNNSRSGEDFDQIAAFSNLGDDDLYEAAGMKFVQADLAHSSIVQFARQFDLNESALPAFVLFKQGIPLRNKKTHKVIVMYGRHSSQGIVDFIDHYFGKDFEVIRKRLQAERRRTVVYYPSYYAPPYYGYYGGYPYYWYSPYYGGYYGPYGGSGVSFGFSVGTGW